MNIINYYKNGEFSQPLDKSKGRTIIAIDSQLVSVHQIIMPKISNAKAIKAIPFALEPELLSDIDELKFFPKKSKKDNAWDVLVVEKKVLNSLREKLEKSQCNVVLTIANFMLLPIIEDKVSYIKNDGIVTYRESDIKGGCIDEDLFNKIFTDESKLEQTDFRDLPNNMSFNLLLNDNFKKYLNPWKPVIFIGLFVLAVSIALDFVNNEQLKNDIDSQTANNKELFTNLFPQVKRIVDIRTQAQQKLEDVRKYNLEYNQDFITFLVDKTNESMRASKVTFENKTINIKEEKK
jgi:type II secretory pathway component PulL